jgi:hypothetical protein
LCDGLRARLGGSADARPIADAFNRPQPTTPLRGLLPAFAATTRRMTAMIDINLSTRSGIDLGAHHSPTRRWRSASCLLGAVLLLAAGARAQEDGFTADFRLQDCSFQSRGENPFFIELEPGHQLVFEGEEEGVSKTLFITVLNATKRVTLKIGSRTRTVTTRVVEEREFEDDEIVEISRNFFAICGGTNDVFYFGEEVDIFEDGEIVSHDGAWLAGKNGAKPGIIMPGTVLLGSRYFQEVAPGVALDQAEHTAMGLHVSVPAGNFSGCLEATETTPLEPGSESTKVYCPDVGLVIDGDLELSEIVEDDD